jgi:hypothetical protein
MVRTCPRCRTTVERAFLCPGCGGQTVAAEGAGPAAPSVTAGVAVDRPTFGGGILVGLLVAQSLYYAARNLAVAVLLGTGGPAAEAEFWLSAGGSAAEQVLQALALFAGGLIAGAGHAQSVAAGGALGVANSLLLSGMLVVLQRTPSEILLYAQPVLHAFVGAASGFVGQRIWQPAPDLSALPRVSRKGEEVLSVALPEYEVIEDAEPLPWGRILLGTVLAVGGTIWARLVLSFVLADSGAGALLQSQFITWELTVVSQVLGGIVAGANTRNGFQYGFWVGMFSGGAIMLLLSAADMTLPTNEALSAIFGLPLPPGSSTAVVFQAGQALVLGLVGGGLGSLILPRIVKKRRSLDRGAA